MKFFKKDSGSIVLEATLVLPFFLMFLLLLVTFIRLMVVDLTLHNALHESTKQVSTHVYPFIQTKYANKDKLQDYIQYKNFILELSTAVAGTNAPKTFEADIVDFISDAGKEKYNPLVREFVLHYADGDILKRENLEVTFDTPVWEVINGTTDYMVSIDAKYKYTVTLPFFKKDIILHKRAVERAWMGTEFDYVEKN